MNAAGLLFTIIACGMLLVLPRKHAPLPLLLGMLYMTPGQVLDVGPAHFTVMRILVTVGFLRVIFKGESLAHGLNNVDRWLMLWAAVLIGSSAFHTSDAWVYRCGIVWTDLGCYFLLRIFLQDWEDVRRLFRTVCMILPPIGLLMLYEKSNGQNLFGFLGGVNESALVRGGHVRAAGPFAHPILAGTVGASFLPMALYLWRHSRQLAIAGILSACAIVFSATSSGPILMVLVIIMGLMLWHLRHRMRQIRWGAFFGLVIIDRIMQDPIYFLMARIDISGGSQGYYRAQLIRSSIAHLDEWWLAGTDYTRHWMQSGIYANTRHTDITNHVLAMGVLGGLPLLIIFVSLMCSAFNSVGRSLIENKGASQAQQFLTWTLGATFFGHLMNFMSISLFDQSIISFYIVMAGIGAVQAGKVPKGTVRTVTFNAPVKSIRKLPPKRPLQTS